MKIIFDFPKNTFYLRVGMKQAALSRLLFVYYSEYYSVIPCRELCCCSRNCCWFSSYLATLERSLTRTFLLLFIRFPVICQVLGGVPDNARVMGCTCVNSPSFLFFFVCSVSRMVILMHGIFASQRITPMPTIASELAMVFGFSPLPSV